MNRLSLLREQGLHLGEDGSVEGFFGVLAEGVVDVGRDAEAHEAHGLRGVHLGLHFSLEQRHLVK